MPLLPNVLCAARWTAPEQCAPWGWLLVGPTLRYRHRRHRRLQMGANCCKFDPNGDEPMDVGVAVKTWKRPKWKSEEPMTEEQLQVGWGPASWAAAVPSWCTGARVQMFQADF